jgi:hypothetical protein
VETQRGAVQRNWLAAEGLPARAGVHGGDTVGGFLQKIAARRPDTDMMFTGWLDGHHKQAGW